MTHRAIRLVYLAVVYSWTSAAQQARSRRGGSGSRPQLSGCANKWFRVQPSHCSQSWTPSSLPPVPSALPRSAVLTRSKSAEQKQQEMAAEAAAQAQRDQQQREVAAAERLSALQPDYESEELSALGDQGKAVLQAAIAKAAAQAEEIAAEAEANYRAANVRAEQEVERMHLQAKHAREQLQAILPSHLHEQLQQASSADAQAVLLSSVRALIDAEPAQPKQIQSAAALPSAVVTPQLHQEQQ